MLVEDCALFVFFFFFKQPPPPVAVTGPSDCTLLVAVVWAGLEPEGDYFSHATQVGREGSFRFRFLLLAVLLTSLLGPCGGGEAPLLAS